MSAIVLPIVISLGVIVGVLGLLSLLRMSSVGSTDRHIYLPLTTERRQLFIKSETCGRSIES